MAKIDILDILRAKKQSPLEFEFDSLWIPPMNYYLTQQDIDQLRFIATSIRLSSDIQKKYKMIDEIMKNRGFKRFSAGTNRIVYSFTEDDRFLAKIAVDKVGMQDNPLEFQNQFLLKPYVAKTFYTSPCGTVGFAERVLPIKNKAEFREIAGDVFEILVHKILGQYVVEDVGSKFFMNWGIRKFHAPVLLDYPYVYKLDGNKLFCTKIMDFATGQTCDGEIDYDAGFNHLVCAKCGKVYLACNLRDDSVENNIIIKGGSTMKVTITKGDQVLATALDSEEVITRPAPTEPSKTTLKASIKNVPVKGSSSKSKKFDKSKAKPFIKASVVGGSNSNSAENETKEETKPEPENKPEEKKPVRTSSGKAKLVAVNEVKEDPNDSDKILIRATVEIKETEKPDDSSEESQDTADEDINTADAIEDSETEVDDSNNESDDSDDEPVIDHELEAKYANYGCEEDEYDNAPRKQPIRTKTSRKPSDGEGPTKKRTTTRIPKN